MPARVSERILSKVLGGKLQGEVEERCSALRPILRIKWACIVLSILNEERLRQLLQQQGDKTNDAIIKKRLEMGTRMLMFIRETLDRGNIESIRG